MLIPPMLVAVAAFAAEGRDSTITAAVSQLRAASRAASALARDSATIDALKQQVVALQSDIAKHLAPHPDGQCHYPEGHYEVCRDWEAEDHALANRAGAIKSAGDAALSGMAAARRELDGIRSALRADSVPSVFQDWYTTSAQPCAEVPWPQLQRCADDALAALRPTLAEREAKLTALIDHNLSDLGKLGFEKRAEEIEEWVELSREAQEEAVKTFYREAADVIAGEAQDQLLEQFKHLNRRKADRWITYLKENVDPRPTEMIAAIHRVSELRGKAKVSADAKFILDRYDELLKLHQVKDLSGSLEMLLDLMCDAPLGAFVARECRAAVGEGKVMAALAYHGRARYVANREVDRLGGLNEAQLKTLDTLHGQLVRFVAQRKDVRRAIAELS